MSGSVEAHPRALLLQRLSEAARILQPAAPAATEVIALLRELLVAVRSQPGGGRFWLLWTATAGAFPTAEQLEQTRRRLELCRDDELVQVFLDATQADAAERGDWDRPLRIVEGGVVLDVNFCAKFVHNTGIQRVVRRLVPELEEFAGSSAFELVAWTRESGAMRTLSDVERSRVVSWDNLDRSLRAPDLGAGELVVPWRSRVLLPEVAEPEVVQRLAALAEFSGNWVGLIGYDLIPVASAHLVDARESERTAHYLTIVKHSDRVFAISDSVATEFGGFTAALASQGMTGPAVQSVPLPTGATPKLAERPASDLPLVLCVGSHEPRKNQEALLFAAETLMREGLRFRMVFVGGGSRRNTLSFDRRVRRLREKLGFAIESVRGVRDAELWQLYREARFTALVSLHEGFGLPVAESLSFGTPALTSNYGSMAEIAADGGCVVTDPRDDDAIIASMRMLLTDDALVERLITQIAARPATTWGDYAAAMWKGVTAGEAS